MHKVAAQAGVVQILFLVGLLSIVAAVGAYIYKSQVLQPPTEIDAASQGTFSSLSSNLALQSATFNFKFSGNIGIGTTSTGTATSFIVDASLDSRMRTDIIAPFATGISSPVVVTNPQSLWSKYQCNTKIYWRVIATSKAGTARSSIQNGTVVCPTPTPTPLPTGISTKKVFVTSTLSNGNLGGLAGADSICQTRASTAGLSGVWKAWLSDSVTAASSRLNHFSGPYVRMDGLIVASSWSGLTSGSLQNPIRINELGKDMYNYINAAWTGTTITGDIITPNCSNWTDGTAGTQGVLGGISATNSYWTVGASSSSVCSNNIALYCLEQ